MTKYNGEERRRDFAYIEQIKQDVSETRTDIALIKNTIEANHNSFRKTADKVEELLEKHNKTLYGNGVEGITTRVSRIGDMKMDLKNHIDDDRKVFVAFGTILVTILLGMGKLIFFKQETL